MTELAQLLLVILPLLALAGGFLLAVFKEGAPGKAPASIPPTSNVLAATKSSKRQARRRNW